MAVSNLPPQAYTKDTLTKAFAWLQTQTKEIKDIATSPEILVGLFHRDKRREDFSAPANSQEFKLELKSLSGEMQPFIKKPRKTEESPQAVTAQKASTQSSLNQSSFLSQLDPETENLINEVTQNLNLSSPKEALRMLIILGYKQIKPVL